MTRMISAAILMFVLVTCAFAGPNAGGTIIAHDAELLMSGTDGSIPICGQGVIPATCSAADPRIDGAYSDPAVFVVYATFGCGMSPRVMGITWGVNYDDANIILPYHGKCGDFELNDDGWPLPGTGSTVTWNTVQSALMIPVYWFGAYTYGAAGELQLTPNPTQGGYFGDDSVPAILDLIAAYGRMGFDMPGLVECVGIPCLGACCDPATGDCELTSCEGCPPPRYWMCGVECTPNPCGPGPIGVCCATDCVCTLTDEAHCLPPSVWNPAWTSCDPNPCDCPPPIAVCCNLETGECTLTIAMYCTGVWHPEWVSCDPNPCLPTPTQRESWGRIKQGYR